MQSGKLVRFLFVYTIIGLIGSYIIVTLFPNLLDRNHSQIEIKQVLPDATLPRPTTMGPVSYADAVAAAAPAVVNIHTTKVITQRINPFFDDPRLRQFFGDVIRPRKRVENSLGSGVIISSNGYILTNNHVIKDADEILVALQDGRTIQATIVGIDSETDIAVLKIALIDLPSIVLGESELLRVGDVVLAIGNPFNVGQTVTLGIVSAKGRSQLGINTFENFIQTDAAINPGNSGGALVNAHGHLIGINTAIFSKSGGSQGIGFAIPAAIAKRVMEDILQFGHVVRGWLGIAPQDITPQLAESFGYKDTVGVVVAGVLRKGPADMAGIQPGDIITHIDGKPVPDSATALNLISTNKPGDKLSIDFLRKGKKLSTVAEVTQRPAPGRNKSRG
ncbi:MAG: PDZ domain-containing protein [Gammaproteobacteria bacterium]|nr:PDZ domain-containing protein [Gammaproteobacteria bacterium]